MIGGELWLGLSDLRGFGFVSTLSLSPYSFAFLLSIYDLPNVSTRGFQASGWIDNGFLILVLDMTFVTCLMFSWVVSCDACRHNCDNVSMSVLGVLDSDMESSSAICVRLALLLECSRASFWMTTVHLKCVRHSSKVLKFSLQ